LDRNRRKKFGRKYPHLGRIVDLLVHSNIDEYLLGLPFLRRPEGMETMEHDEELCLLMGLCRYESFRDGQPIFFEGEVGDKMYIQVDGTCAVTNDELQIAAEQAREAADMLAPESEKGKRNKSHTPVRSGSVMAVKSVASAADSAKSALEKLGEEGSNNSNNSSSTSSSTGSKTEDNSQTIDSPTINPKAPQPYTNDFSTKSKTTAKVVPILDSDPPVIKPQKFSVSPKTSSADKPTRRNSLVKENSAIHRSEQGVAPNPAPKDEEGDDKDNDKDKDKDSNSTNDTNPSSKQTSQLKKKTTVMTAKQHLSYWKNRISGGDGKNNQWEKISLAPSEVLFNTSKGDFFGEMSVMSSMPRTITIVASSNCLFLTISKADWKMFMYKREKRKRVVQVHLQYELMRTLYKMRISFFQSVDEERFTDLSERLVVDGEFCFSIRFRSTNPTHSWQRSSHGLRQGNGHHETRGEGRQVLRNYEWKSSCKRQGGHL